MTDLAQFEQWVSFPVEQVFLFFANPANLPRIMPPATGTKLVRLKLVAPPAAQAAITGKNLLAGAGSEIVTSFRLVPYLPLRAEWIALITEFEWNHHFADVQTRGPFRSFHHRHELTRQSRNGIEGTLVRDAIRYDVGYGPLGRLAQRFFVSRQLKKTFEYRQMALEKLLAAQATGQDEHS